MKLPPLLPHDWFRAVDQGVQGWCSGESAGVLWEFASRNPSLGVIVEIGSAWGKSTIVLAEASRRVGGGPVYSVDPHTGGIGYLKERGLEKINSFPEFWSNIAKHGLEDHVVPVVATSEEAAALWDPARPIRLLYIDGLHTAEAVAIDIQHWVPRLSPGGIVVFDDYHQPSVPAYRAKIDELLPRQPGVMPLETVGGGLVCAKKSRI